MRNLIILGIMGIVFAVLTSVCGGLLEMSPAEYLPLGVVSAVSVGAVAYFTSKVNRITLGGMFNEIDEIHRESDYEMSEVISRFNRNNATKIIGAGLVVSMCCFSLYLLLSSLFLFKQSIGNLVLITGLSSALTYMISAFLFYLVQGYCHLKMARKVTAFTNVQL